MPRSHKKRTTRIVATRIIHNGRGGDRSDDHNGHDSNPLSTLSEHWNQLFQKSRFLRIIVIEFPILSLLAVSFASQGLLYIQETYLHEYLKELQFTPERQELEQTHPRMECAISDLTALEPRSLFVQENETYLDATERVLLHGTAVFPNVLSKETATNLRQYIVKRHKATTTTTKLLLKDQVSAAMNKTETIKENHVSFTLSATEHASVAKALQEIGTSPLLVDTLEALLGPDPSLMEFQVITTARKGAYPQDFHADTPPRFSAAMNQYTFAPLYTLLIPLQDTTPDMGPTAVCPGSHRCYFTESCFGFGADFGDNVTEQVGFQVLDPDLGYWKAGYGLLYSSSTTHRETWHKGEGLDRTVMVLSFAARPDYYPHGYRPRRFSRFPPLDAVYAIQWHHMGQSLSDLRDPYQFMSMSWMRWTGLFFSNPPEKLAWTSIPFDLIRAAHRGQRQFQSKDIQQQKREFKGIMGMLSAIFFVPVEIFDKGKKGDPYSSEVEHHAVQLLERIQIVCYSAFLFASLCYVAMVLATNLSWLPWTTARLLIGAGLLYGIGVWIRIKVVDSSDWARDLAEGDMAVVPRETAHLLPFVQEIFWDNYTRQLPTPSVQDVLVDDFVVLLGPRLAAQANLLDYMPGNRRWRSFAKAQSVYFLQYSWLPDIFQEAVVDFVISLTRTNAGYTFYTKNLFEDYIEIPHDSLRQRTRRMILDQILRPNRRLSVLTDIASCNRRGAVRTLCSMRPQIIRDLFGDDIISHTSMAKRYMPQRGRQNTLPSFAFLQFTADVPTRSKETCATEVDDESEDTIDWNVGDVVQIQLNQMGGYPSRKWVNAMVVAVKPSHKYGNLYNLEAFSIYPERVNDVSGKRLRTPAKREADLKTLALYSVGTKSGPVSVFSCPRQVGFFHLGNDNGCFPEMAQAYTIPDDTILVEISFEFYEKKPLGGGVTVFARLGGQDLELGQFHQNAVEMYQPAHFLNVLVSVDSLSKTHNKVSMVIPPDGWVTSNKSGSKTLIFGVVAVGVDVGIDVGKIMVRTTASSGQTTRCAEWEPHDDRLMTLKAEEDDVQIKFY